MKLRGLASRFAGDSSGSVALQFCIVATLLLAVGGGAIDYMRASRTRASMQEAADAASLAAAKMSHKTQTEREALAALVFARNYAAEDSGAAPSLSTSFTEKTVIVSASRAVPTTLLSIIGRKSLNTAVVSEAARARSAPICILALETGLPNGLEIYGNATLNAENCAGVSNSSDDSGLKTYGGAVARAAEFGVVGNYEGAFEPAPAAGIDPIVDPLAEMRLPEPGACVDITGRLSHSTFTLDPGTYCGGVQISAGAVVHLNPGFYHMLDGPFAAQSGAIVTGDAVTIGFSGPTSTLYLQGGADVRLTAPDIGDFKGIVLFSEATSPHIEWMIVSGSAVLDIVGTMYLPTHEIWLKSPDTDQATLNAQTSTYGLIARRFRVQGRSRLEVTHGDPDNASVLRLQTDTRLVR